MTYDIKHALGCAASGCYTNSEALWEYMLAASMHTGDRVWRFPLFKQFKEILKKHNHCADVKTHGPGAYYGQAASCRVAAFLKEFVACGDWLHLDTRSVMRTDGKDYMYLRKGMSGRPVRTLVEFLSQLVCNRD